MQSFPVERDLEITTTQPFTDRALLLVCRGCRVGCVGAPIPEHDSATPILTLGDSSLESVVINRVIFHLHREPLDGGIEAGSFRDGPTLHHSIELESKVEVEMARSVFLDDETKSTRTTWRCRLIAGWLRCFPEIPLSPVLSELRTSAALGSSARFHCHERSLGGLPLLWLCWFPTCCDRFSLSTYRALLPAAFFETGA